MTALISSKRAHYHIVIIGGGTAGIISAALLRHAGQTSIAIVEPARQHFYQPLWTLVGAGVVRKERTARDEAHYMPRGVDWVQDSVLEISPERNHLITRSGAQIYYDALIVAAGAQLNWDAIPGLIDAVAGDAASTNYSYELAPKTWQLIRNFKGGTALFHMPGTPIKCPGAPQKIMYLAADYFRRKRIRANVIYGSALPSIYGIKEYAAVLAQVVDRYGIDTRFQHELVEIRAQQKEAVFFRKNDGVGEKIVIPYDILHVVPPQTAPDFIRRSPLADPEKPREGWVKVDKHTLQHVSYSNIFALGDVAATPNAKTGASAARQAPVVVSNVLAVLGGKEPVAQYNGYVACPIITGYGRMLLCEFDYSLRPTPHLPAINTMRERYDMWLLKRYLLPWFYWNALLRGRAMPFLDREVVAQTSVEKQLSSRVAV